MYIIVAGGGKVGFYLAKQLIADGHELAIIERVKAKADAISRELGNIVVHGDASDSTPMQEAGMNRADMVVAVTGDDEDNLIICQIAKKKFGVKRAIARINNPKNERIFKVLGIDATVSSVDMIVAQIERQIPAHSLIHLLTLRDVGVSFIEARIPPKSPLVGRTIVENNLPNEIVLSLIIRDQRAIIPHGATAFEAGDELVALTTLDQEDILGRLIRGELLKRKTS